MRGIFYFNKYFFMGAFYDIILSKRYGQRMKKIKVLGLFAALFAGVTTSGHAAYPVYSGYNSQSNLGVANAGRTVYLPTTNGGVVATNSIAAAGQTRVTGALPRVGNSAVNAGRRYYQSTDFDRLADSGLYIGLSAAYTASLMGEFSADYAGEDGAFKVPGAFISAGLEKDTVIPFQLSLGATINSDLRIDFSYTRYGNMSYPQKVQTDDGDGGYATATATGGAITANVAMLNLYYNIDSYTGYVAGGSLRPYVGAGVGVSLNTVADYNVWDNSFYSYANPVGAPAETETAVSNINAYHNGGTSERLAFSLEGGVTTELGNGMKLDLFVRYMHLGRVQSSGSVVLTQDVWIADGMDGENAYPEIDHYTNWTESANLSTVDVGARLRLQF